MKILSTSADEITAIVSGNQTVDFKEVSTVCETLKYPVICSEAKKSEKNLKLAKEQSAVVSKEEAASNAKERRSAFREYKKAHPTEYEESTMAGVVAGLSTSMPYFMKSINDYHQNKAYEDYMSNLSVQSNLYRNSLYNSYLYGTQNYSNNASTYFYSGDPSTAYYNPYLAADFQTGNSTNLYYDFSGAGTTAATTNTINWPSFPGAFAY